jgi:mannose-6-phosphate isomerase
MSKLPKTILCDIDGTLIKHCGDIINQYKSETPELLPNTINLLKKWEKNQYKIILITGRKECTRNNTIKQLDKLGIIYDDIIFGLTSGDRILINDRKRDNIRNTAYSINVTRNKGLYDYDFNSKHVTINDNNNFDKIIKPWGSEELLECNDKYVVKRLFMKKDCCCSLQYHELKKESIYVISGLLKILIGKDINNLEEKIYKPNEYITIEPYTIHRMIGVEDSIYIETSTNELWDVVRLEDKYGRI